MSMNYLKSTMHQLSNILYNTSQSDSPYNSKDKILDSIKVIIQNYNDSVSEEYKVQFCDFRKDK
jgi:hypothetical protein